MLCANICAASSQTLDVFFICRFRRGSQNYEIVRMKHLRSGCVTFPWGEHLDLARCAAVLGQHDAAQGIIVMAGCLHILQRDLVAHGYTDDTEPVYPQEIKSQAIDHLRAVLAETP